MISKLIPLCLVLVLWFNFTFVGKAQDDCVVKLNEAEKLYEEGKIEKIPEMLASCIENGFNKENKIAALRLLTLVYLFDDNQMKAENSLLNLLKENPEFKTNQAIDPVEFTRLYNSFNTTPIFSLGIVLGVNKAKPWIKNDFSTTDLAKTKYQSNGFGFNAGLRGVYHLNNQWDIILEPAIATNSYSFNEQSSEVTNTLAEESMTYIDFPVFASYVFHKYHNFSIYAEAGAIYGMYLSSSFSGILTFIDNTNPNYEGPSVNTAENRNKYLAMGSIGVGTKFKISQGNLALNLRYKFGLNNVVYSSDPRKAIQSILTDYMHVDDAYSISNFSISISYNREFYIHHKKPGNKTNYDVLK